MKIKTHYRIMIIMLIFFITLKIGAIEIGISHAAFQNNNNKYLEIYIQVISQTVNLKQYEDSTYQASVDFMILIKNNKEKIVSYDKFNIKSDRGSVVEDFITLRRLSLDNGDYFLEIEAIDNYDKTNIFKHKADVTINFPQNAVFLSDIELLANIEKSNNSSNPFVKSGYYLEPVLSYFVPEKVKKLGIYLEAYNSNLEADDTKIKLSIAKGFYGSSGSVVFSKKLNVKKANISPILTRIDITSLVSGNYHILAELINTKEDVLVKKYVNFQRSNPEKDIFVAKNTETNTYENSYATKLPADSVIYSIRAMLPILTASDSEAANMLLANKDVEKGRYFIWSYWANKAGIKGYSTYMKYANIVDVRFRSQVGYGFETDRGRIYLKYGMPSQIFKRENEPTAPPYEMWFYNSVEQDNQNNVKFVFYMPSLANNDYVLLHSNCRGEKNDPIWFYKLYSKRNDSNIRNVRPDQVKDFYAKLKNSFNNNAVILWEELK